LLDTKIFEQTCRQVGVIVKAAVVRSPEIVSFFSRWYNPWYGDTTSTADLPRMLTKFHVSTVCRGNDTPITKLRDRIIGLYVTDRKSPVVKRIIKAYYRVTRETPPVVADMTVSYMSQGLPLCEWYPQEGSFDGQITKLLEIWPEMNLDPLFKYLDAVTSVDQLLTMPPIRPPIEKAPKIAVDTTLGPIDGPEMPATPPERSDTRDLPLKRVCDPRFSDTATKYAKRAQRDASSAQRGLDKKRRGGLRGGRGGKERGQGRDGGTSVEHLVAQLNMLHADDSGDENPNWNDTDVSDADTEVSDYTIAKNEFIRCVSDLRVVADNYAMFADRLPAPLVATDTSQMLGHLPALRNFKDYVEKMSSELEDRLFTEHDNAWIEAEEGYYNQGIVAKATGPICVTKRSRPCGQFSWSYMTTIAAICIVLPCIAAYVNIEAGASIAARPDFYKDTGLLRPLNLTSTPFSQLNEMRSNRSRSRSVGRTRMPRRGLISGPVNAAAGLVEAVGNSLGALNLSQGATSRARSRSRGRSRTPKTTTSSLPTSRPRRTNLSNNSQTRNSVVNQRNFPSGFVSKPNQKHLEINDEYIAEVYSSQAFVCESYAVNPGQIGIFPWLYKLASLYEKYHFDMLEFYYKPEVSAYNNNGQAGKVMLAFDFDSSDNPPATKQQVEDTYPHADAMPYETVVLRLDPRELANFVKMHYVRTGILPGGSDIKTYDIGLLNVCTIGNTTTGAILGELRVRYRCVLDVPVLNNIVTIPKNYSISAYTTDEGSQAPYEYLSAAVANIEYPVMEFANSAVYSMSPGVFGVTQPCNLLVSVIAACYADSNDLTGFSLTITKNTVPVILPTNQLGGFANGGINSVLNYASGSLADSMVISIPSFYLYATPGDQIGIQIECNTVSGDNCAITSNVTFQMI
jgi:hypothetical protein